MSKYYLIKFNDNDIPENVIITYRGVNRTVVELTEEELQIITMFEYMTGRKGFIKMFKQAQEKIRKVLE